MVRFRQTAGSELPLHAPAPATGCEYTMSAGMVAANAKVSAVKTRSTFIPTHKDKFCKTETVLTRATFLYNFEVK